VDVFFGLDGWTVLGGGFFGLTGGDRRGGSSTKGSIPKKIASFHASVLQCQEKEKIAKLKLTIELAKPGDSQTESLLII
jgi:hypothetical protein